MPRIVLKELDSERSVTITDSDFLIGRDPAGAVVVDGPKSKVVSGRHARIFVQDGAAWIEDVSRNGTVVDHERLQRGVRHALRQGQIIGLGDTGPRYSVELLDIKHVAQTIVEPSPMVAPPTQPAQPPVSPTAPQPAMSLPHKPGGVAAAHAPPVRPMDAATVHVRQSDAERSRAQAAAAEPSTEPNGPAPDWIVHIVLRETHTNQRWDVRGDVIKIGRAPVCLVQIPAEAGASVSRVHSEVLIEDGGVTLKDAGSRNGTFHNGERIEGPLQVTKGDLVMLGAGGPTLSVEDLHIVKGDDRTRSTPGEPGGSGPSNRVTPDSPGSARGTAPGGIKKAIEPAANLLRRSFADLDRTPLPDLVENKGQRVRALVWTSLGAMVVIAAAEMGVLQSRVSRSERAVAAGRAAFEARSDSLRHVEEAEASRLRLAFDSARRASAPRRIVDSLRDALADATRKTGQLALAMTRARQSLDAQLASGDSARRSAEDEMARLRLEVLRAQSSGGTAGLDSLRRALRDAETKAADVAVQLRAVRGVDLAQVAQLNQGAVGLVTMFADTGGAEGSGFAISPSGYFVTNRQVVTSDAGRVADSVFVTMADQRHASWLRADIVAVGQGDLDIAVLHLRNYSGPYIKKVDWTSSNAHQGEAGAIIGIRSGTTVALNSGDVVRTSMSAGMFEKISSANIQFDGFSEAASSGSPVFNASGEVVAVHLAGQPGVSGLGLALPVSRAVPLLPTDARTELGLR